MTSTPRAAWCSASTAIAAWRAWTRPSTSPQPKFTPLADRYQGKRFNSPNDARVSQATAISTSPIPPYGLEKQWEDPSARDSISRASTAAGRSGEVTLLTSEMTRPNGIAFSPDEKRLYVAQSDPKARDLARLRRRSRTARSANGRVLFDATSDERGTRGLPDGLKMDTDGNLFATGPGGVLVLSPEGKHLGTIMTGQATSQLRVRRRRPHALHDGRHVPHARPAQGQGDGVLKALPAHRSGEAAIADVPVPPVAADEVLVRVRACGICGSDVHGYDGSTGRRIPPLVMGHEAAGKIERIGSAASPDSRRAIASPSIPRSRAAAATTAASGQINLCESRTVLGVSCADYRRHGAFAEFVSVPARILYHLPAALPFEHAALIEAVSVAVHAVGREAPRARTTTVVVIGCGTIGLAHRSRSCAQTASQTRRSPSTSTRRGGRSRAALGADDGPGSGGDDSAGEVTAPHRRARGGSRLRGRRRSPRPCATAIGIACARAGP